ncbi:aldo/keto reductase [Marispirochaeta aestuarii]|uniref:aldo/keto reductase n=1 Tax=Marispirochaeta aestuarii TaxID=1963862 RepID=UPI0029C64403|nr:aldo/keto reductase [Marispirochaeta aestuarii]
MHYNTLGPLEVSCFTLGTWSFAGGGIWGDREKKESVRIVHAAMDKGINLIDTAEGYGDGVSESVLGEALEGRRDKVFLASKFLPQKISRPGDIRTILEESLRRLRTDYIDLYQQHWPFTDASFTQAEAEGVVTRLMEEGKIRHFGVCNFGPADLAGSSLPIVSDQIGYSLLFRAIEYEMLPFLREKKLGVLTYSALMQGLLSGRYSSPEEFPVGRRRTRHFSTDNPNARHGEAGHEDLVFSTIAALKAIADEAGLSLPHCGIGWVLAQPGISSVIIGSGNEKQLADNLRYVEEDLPADVVDRLTRESQELKNAMGPNADLWQRDSRIH